MIPRSLLFFFDGVININSFFYISIFCYLWCRLDGAYEPSEDPIGVRATPLGGGGIVISERERALQGA